MVHPILMDTFRSSLKKKSDDIETPLHTWKSNLNEEMKWDKFNFASLLNCKKKLHNFFSLADFKDAFFSISYLISVGNVELFGTS